MTRAPHLQNRIAVAALRFAAATALFALTQLAAAADPPRSVLRFEKAMIVDATGFEAPMAATTLFLPAGWKTQGGVLWGQQFACTNGYNFDWKAQSSERQQGASDRAVLPVARVLDVVQRGAARDQTRLYERAVVSRRHRVVEEGRLAGAEILAMTLATRREAGV